MLSEIIVNSYKTFIEISLWLSLLIFVIGGGIIGGDINHGFLGVLIGGIFWFLGAIIFFGAFLALEDIRERVKNIESFKLRLSAKMLPDSEQT